MGNAKTQPTSVRRSQRLYALSQSSWWRQHLQLARHTAVPNMKFLTFDVTGAFLQCDWRGEELYVRLPKDIPAHTTYMGQTNLAGRVIKVQKAWYGLNS